MDEHDETEPMTGPEDEAITVPDLSKVVHDVDDEPVDPGSDLDLPPFDDEGGENW